MTNQELAELIMKRYEGILYKVWERHYMNYLCFGKSLPSVEEMAKECMESEE